MCRTVHSVLSTLICGIQMLVRVFMTIILMIENLIRMILQTLYNFISFLLQMISLIPICFVFLVTARLKCFMCGGGGPCPINRGGACDCLMSAAAIVILFFIFRATGVLDKIFYRIGYVQAPPLALVRFAPTPGDVTECSRNDSTTKPMTFLRYMDLTEPTTETTETTETETETIDMETTTSLTTILDILRMKTLAATVVTPSPEEKDGTNSKSKVVSTLNRFLGKISTLAKNPRETMTEHPKQVTTTQKMIRTAHPVETAVTNVVNAFPVNMTTVLYYFSVIKENES